MKNKFIILVLLTAALLLIAACGNNEEGGTGKLEYGKLLQQQLPEKGDKIAVINTSKGDITVMFFPEQAPKAVENFITLAEQGYYNGIIFHRVMKEFMIQTGDPTGTGRGGESCWGKPFEDEFTNQLLNIRGSLCMANSGVNTNGSQFFINQNTGYSEANWNYITKQYNLDEDVVDIYKKIGGGAPWLDGHHTVFGQVIDGMDVVDAIASVNVDASKKPYESVVINSITITEYEG